MNMQSVAVLGATGSIGANTLDVLKLYPNRYKIVALSANTNVEKAFDLCKEFKPQYVVMANADAANDLQIKIKSTNLDINVLAGQDGLCFICELDDIDIVVAGIVGSAGLESAIASAISGKKILLANKETLVMAGSIFLEQAIANNSIILPVDSEHNALFQCMPQGYQIPNRPEGITKVILTASGGPFRSFSKEQLKKVTPEQASYHPTYKMGPKITVDCATLMNKGLEVIEASLLYSLKPQEIEVVVHPQSIVHSMVEYMDGSVLAELGNPDMRTPIASCLSWPQRISSGAKSLNLIKAKQLEFYQPDYEKFPCLRLAYDALECGQGACCVLNASNEVAVMQFLQNKIGFCDIPKVIESALSKFCHSKVNSLEDIKEIDRETRKFSFVI